MLRIVNHFSDQMNSDELHQLIHTLYNQGKISISLSGEITCSLSGYLVLQHYQEERVNQSKKFIIEIIRLLFEFIPVIIPLLHDII